MRNIDKNFPGVVALSNVDFTLRTGEIHALMGENGAGKSTLIKVLTGVEEFDNGEIRLDGIDHPIINKSPQEAQTNGISTVYQEVNLCSNLSVAENVFIGREPMKMGRIDWKTINKKSKEILKSFNINIDVTSPLGNYSVAIQQMVAIARAVDISSKVLILDEPTSSLDEVEVEKLFAVMRKLKNDGIGIVFVTHFLEQVYKISDRITVLRNGSLVGEYKTENLPSVQLVAKMMGKDLDELSMLKNKVTSKKKEKREVILEAKDLGHSGTIKPFNLCIHKGEVIGLSGLLGSGRSELSRSIYGADKPDRGELLLKGEKLSVHAPIDAMKASMAYLPENRKEEGIIADLSVRENIMIALQAKSGMFKQISKKEQEEFTDKYIELLQIKTADREVPVKQLSGGNQQKVILGRWLLTNPDFMILDEPTRGIDVGTKAEIQKMVLKLAKEEGKSIIFISSEIEEMLRVCSKMVIMRDGCKVGELEEDKLTQDEIMKSIAGGGQNDEC